MSAWGMSHTVFAFVAIGAGGVLLMLPKGTRWHRTLGHAYAMAMVGVNATAFSIYRLTGSWGPFHFAAVVGGGTVLMGMATVLLRRPKKHWIEAHATWMSWSYVGLMAALAAESLTRFVMPRIAPLLEEQALWGAFWTVVGIASFGVFGVGWWIVKHRLPTSLARTPQAMHAEKVRLRQLEEDRAGLTA